MARLFARSKPKGKPVKGLICIAITAAAAAIFAPAGTASKPGTVINVDASFTVPYTIDPASAVELTPTRVNLGPRLGSFIIDGFTIVVPDCVEIGPSCTFRRQTIFVFTAGNGGKLGLFENIVWLQPDPVPPMTWAVDSTQSTAKYEGYSGSGTYTLDFSVPGRVTISLTGTLATA
jgi:hypothetical protein